jgi:hypothetical protein
VAKLFSARLLPGGLAIAFLATTGCATIPVTRELFVAELPAGWKEAHEPRTTLTLVEPDPGPPLPSSRFIAATKDCACIISAMARSSALTPQQYYEMNSRFMLANATELKVVRFTEFGGHHGAGVRRLVQHPYPITTAAHAFTFIEQGVVCSLLTSVSDTDAGRAEKILEQRLPAVEAIARSLRLKPPAVLGASPAAR